MWTSVSPWFRATKGGGAFMNLAPLMVSEEATAEEAVVATGYGATAEAADSMIKGMTVGTDG
jgi:fructose-1,6-bisphosphatase/inositol monophosphatase family enzyme